MYATDKTYLFFLQKQFHNHFLINVYISISNKNI